MKTIIRSAPSLPIEYMMIRKDYLTELHRALAQTRAAYTRLHRQHIRAIKELHDFQLERQKRAVWP